MASPLPWFDGHLDLAYLAEHGRRMELPVDQCGGGLADPAVTFPSLRDGNVKACFSTLFVQPRTPSESGPWTYTTDKEAHANTIRQIQIYEQWHDRKIIRLAHLPENGAPLAVTLLMEGAVGVRNVEEFAWFYDHGVRIVALTWATGNHWSGGDRTLVDVTPEGHKLLGEIDARDCIHDVSHLSEKAFWTVLNITSNRKIASHSNCRALLPGKEFPERNLSDEQITALVGANGIIGINLFNPFLVSGPAAPKHAAIADVLRHIQHMEQLCGRRDFLALGSDFDGGFPRTNWCENLDGPEHFHRLAQALAKAGWSDADIHRFAWQNWADLIATLPPLSPLE